MFSNDRISLGRRGGASILVGEDIVNKDMQMEHHLLHDGRLIKKRLFLTRK